MIKNNQPICETDLRGNKYWYLTTDDISHLKDDSFSIESTECSIGTKFWFLHRLDGPAAEYCNGDKEWFYYGKLHRLNGPAIEHANGKKYWYYHGKWIYCYSQEEFERLIKLKALW